GRGDVPINAMTRDYVPNVLRMKFGKESEIAGVVAGLSQGGERRLVTYGRADSADGRALNADTVFGIASITKVFTALVLADMVAKGEVRLTDPVKLYLPADSEIPMRDGRSITLIDLATHTSGLPGLPNNFDPKAANPLASYMAKDLYNFLSSYSLPTAPGSTFAYSNVGYGLLGHVLALRAGQDFEQLVVSRICDPLGLESTRVNPTASMRARMVTGHARDLKKVPHFDIGPVLAGGGALLSTGKDMLTFLDAALGVRPTSLGAVFASLVAIRRNADEPDLQAAEGWFVSASFGDELIFKDGSLGGYSAFIGYSPGSAAGVVFLSNAQIAPKHIQIGEHLLNAAYPL
ncbi:MAG: serine hydrolase domain-containing protein, partial [Rhodospirillaceae bacterium]